MARQIDIRVLGFMEVLVDDRPVALPGKRLRGLLAALLVRPVRTPDQLIEDVWGVRAHRTARASLHLRRLASTARCGRLRPRERPVADARRARGAGSRHRRVPARGRLIP
ncbi:MAG TPA: hypothetical protein VFT35_04750 [Gaiellaceae bacterium]|nr:hypothetical protein [Gaiellaceae bacterium]